MDCNHRPDDHACRTGSGPLSPWLYTGLCAAGLPAICIETRRMKGATAAMAVKTDRNDARAIAHAMRAGWFTVVHVKTAESQELRLLLVEDQQVVFVEPGDGGFERELAAGDLQPL